MLAIAISGSALAPPGARLSLSAGELLGDSFPNLRVQWSSQRTSEPGLRVTPSLYVAGIGLVLLATMFAAYLLFRDIHRSVRLSELRSNFVASVSHELKTPLTVIRMYAEMLAIGQCRDSTSAQDYHHTILNESERLAQLVQNILDFSKAERGEETYSLQPTHIAEVARAAARAVQYGIARQGFELAIVIDDALPTIQADGAALEQAIVNLLTNAIKYSGASRQIELRLESRESEIAIAVTDWGIGILTDEQARIFESFYRVKSAETKMITGTGLGLTLVQRIVNGHGGKVSVSSAPGMGSTFTIHLPAEGKGNEV